MIVPLGGERMGRSCEINYPNLGFHVILDIRDTSLMGRTHLVYWTRWRELGKNKFPQFRVLRGSKPADWLKMTSTL